MSPEPVNFARVGSKVCVMVWLTVPGAATGVPAVTITEPPPSPATEDTLRDIDTTPPDASTDTAPPMFNSATTTINEGNLRKADRQSII